MDVQEKIKEYCKKHEIKFNELSEKLNVSKAYMSSLMTGQRKITLNIFVRFLKIIDKNDREEMINCYLNNLDLAEINIKEVMMVNKFKESILQLIKEYLKENA